MGFLSKIRNRVKKQIQPGNMIVRDMGPGNIPRRPDIFGRGSFLFGRRPRGNMGSDFRMPQIGGILREGKKRRGGFGFELGEAIRRLKEQRDMGMPRMDFGDQIGYKRPNKNPSMPIAFNDPSFRMIGTPQPIPRAEIDISALESLPMGDMPMTQDLPEVAPIEMMPQMRMDGMQDMEPRMMMQAGEDVSLERELFSLQAQLENLQKQLRLDRSYNDDQAVINTSAEMDAIQKRMQEILQESGRTMSDLDRALMGGRTMSDIDRGRTMSDLDRQMGRTMSDLDMSRPQLAGGGDFPDLTGDGKVTQADILKGRGVQLKAEGGEMMTQENEIDAMLGGMDSEEAGAMEDLEQMAPEMEMIDQLVTMVVQMIQQGASEEEVIMFLREQGLDDEDIGTVLQLVAEMAEAEAMPQDGIGAELEQLV